MSWLQEKREATRTRAETRRRKWQPKVGGWPLREFRRYYKRRREPTPTSPSFCRYFWTVVLMVLWRWSPLVAGFLLLAAFFVVMPIASTWDEFGWWSLLVGPSIAVGIAVAVLTLMWLLLEAIPKLVRSYRLRRNNARAKPPTNESPGALGQAVGLVADAIRAWKYKLCPIVVIPPEVEAD